jgi:hypothetical protein
LSLDGYSFNDDSVQNCYLQDLSSRKELFTPIGQLLLGVLMSMAGGNRLPERLEPPTSNTLATHQAFEQLTGVALTSSFSPGPSFVFHLLLERAFVFSDNIRSQPQYKFSYADLHNQPIDLSSGEQLARYLFLKKNGSYVEREQFRIIKEMFSRLTGYSFEVGFDLPDISTQLPKEKSSEVELMILVNSHWGDIPLAFSGAGRTEALFISTLIAATNDQIILLDEPALNIHVTMQKALLNEIQTLNGNRNQFVIVTHSPALVSPDAIAKLSRFFIQQGHTCRVAINPDKMDTEEFASLEKELRRSTDARAMLLSRGVILVEGETEQGALSLWFEKRFGVLLESDDIIIYSVNSDKNFSKFVQFLHQFNIPWVIICDGKVIGDCITARSKPRIVRQLEKAGIADLPDYSDKDFLHLCQQLEAYGVFTLAKDLNDEFEALPIIQAHQQEAKDQVGDSKVRQAQYIAEAYDCPDEVATLLEKVARYLKNLWGM